MKEYWTQEYKDICDNVVFRVKQINPITFIGLVTASIDFENATWVKQQEFITQTLLNVQWTKNGSDWYPLIMEDGEPRLPELKDNPSLSFDIFYRVRREVINPVFTESKTFQDLTSVRVNKTSKK